MKKGIYEIIESRVMYKNPWIEVKEEHVIGPNGKASIFGTIDYGSGVSVLALDNNRNIFLIREYYYVLERYGVQLPSGGIENGETALDAAKKELLEETGLIADTWQDLGITDPLTMIIKSPAYLFLATNLKTRGDEEEGITVIKKTFEEAYQMVLDSKITHGPSCVAILKAKAYLE